MVAFDVAPTAVFAVLKIGFHTRDCKVIVTAIQSGEAAVFTMNRPTVLVEDGFVCELVVFKQKILFGSAIVSIFRA